MMQGSPHSARKLKAEVKMKKQFNRVRQFTHLNRAEKTEVLSDDLLQVEKRLELVKQVSHSVHKKLTACLQGQQGVDMDKRSLRSPSKKLPFVTLAQGFVEGAALLGEESLLGKMLKVCGETEDLLAQELLLFELQMEKDVIEPLYTLAEVEIPNIQKQRKHLSRLVQDLDSTRTRWHQASKSSASSSKEQPGTKADTLKEELEDAASRMEICRDLLSADLYSFTAKEINYANYFQTFVALQADYHRKSLELLQNVIPQIKTHQELWVEKPCFGTPLEEHLHVTGREVAFPLETCVSLLLHCGLQEEGLFRVAPFASKLKKLKASLDCGFLDVQEYSSDPHAVASALKSYLRELPEPLLTFDLYDEWIQASNVQNLEKRLQDLLQVCEKLPKANSDNFKYLMKFLAKLCEYEDVNKMTAGNIAIVLGPNLLWPQTEGSVTDMMTAQSLQIVRIIEPIIQYADWFFPGDIEFNIMGNYGSSLHINHNYSLADPDADADHSDSKQDHKHPLSVATDNTMLKFHRRDGALKSEDLLQGIGQSDIQTLPPGGQTQLPKLSPLTPQKGVSQSSIMSDRSLGGLSPGSLNLTPFTPPSFSFYSTISSHGHSAPDGHSSPRLLPSTLPKARRHRPRLPPPSPHPPSPQPLGLSGAALLDMLNPTTDCPYSPDLPISSVQPSISEDQSTSTLSALLSEPEDECEITKL